MRLPRLHHGRRVDWFHQGQLEVVSALRLAVGGSGQVSQLSMASNKTMTDLVANESNWHNL
jgi:hypothetical protein